MFSNEADFKKKLRKKVRKSLCRELTKEPSHQDVVDRVEDYIVSRDIIFVFNIVVILFIWIFFTFVVN